MKIYTKTGDLGETSLLGGIRVPKSNIRITSYGNVDELNSWIGLVNNVVVNERSKETLCRVQNTLFTIGSHLASSEKSHFKLPELKEEEIALLEEEIDFMNETLPELQAFILPGGHVHVSYCHLARTVCRRAERSVVELHQTEKVAPIIIAYLNRLSDYLFVLSRKIANDLGATEIEWKPNTL